MKKHLMITAIVGLVLTGLTASVAKAETHFSIGIGVGPGYYAPPPVVYRAPYPGPGYFWNDGYYDPYGVWVGGLWVRRSYVTPYYAAPRYYRGDYVYRRDFDRDDVRRGRNRDRGRSEHRR